MGRLLNLLPDRLGLRAELKLNGNNFFAELFGASNFRSGCTGVHSIEWQIERKLNAFNFEWGSEGVGVK